MLNGHPRAPRDVQHREATLEERQALHGGKALVRGRVGSARARGWAAAAAGEDDAIAEHHRGVTHPGCGGRPRDVEPLPGGNPHAEVQTPQVVEHVADVAPAEHVQGVADKAHRLARPRRRSHVVAELELLPRRQKPSGLGLPRVEADIEDPGVVKAVLGVAAAEQHELSVPGHCAVTPPGVGHAVLGISRDNQRLPPRQTLVLARRVADADVLVALKDAKGVGEALEEPLRAAEERHDLAARDARHGNRGERARAPREGRVAGGVELLELQGLLPQVEQVQIVEKVRAAALAAEEQDLVAVPDGSAAMQVPRRELPPILELFALRVLHPRVGVRSGVHPELEHLLPSGFHDHVAVRVPLVRQRLGQDDRSLAAQLFAEELAPQGFGSSDLLEGLARAGRSRDVAGTQKTEHVSENVGR
mmetsp:Transcript_14600/g.63242  ORF Transcript_14600/g.63242 Transcript_14600/m.63242 type:complete len:419 (+) Transcript_14600:387-1643(+)